MRLSDLPAELLTARPHLFSPLRVPLARATLARMAELIAAVEAALAKVGPDATAPYGVFYGYDFHIGAEGPQLIEINTNAGGGWLAALQAERDDVLSRFVEMLRGECARPLRTLALVDDDPPQQYLYPEFIACQRVCAEHGLQLLICDPSELMLCHGNLWVEETRLDLVYNRLTDFSLGEPRHAILREAWRQGFAVTPNPTHHARYADKKRLIALSDEAHWAAWGLDAATRRILRAGIPPTVAVTRERADELWQRRRSLFFKPTAGYGAKGAYRGDKLTRRVFEEILAGDYVAQAWVPPMTVSGEVAGELITLKADIRNYVYRGEVQFVAARLYQGQTTNFRTPGGGFAVVEVSA